MLCVLNQPNVGSADFLSSCCQGSVFPDIFPQFFLLSISFRSGLSLMSSYSEFQLLFVGSSFGYPQASGFHPVHLKYIKMATTLTLHLIELSRRLKVMITLHTHMRAWSHPKKYSQTACSEPIDLSISPFNCIQTLIELILLV